jgi:hypothetical protein
MTNALSGRNNRVATESILGISAAMLVSLAVAVPTSAAAQYVNASPAAGEAWVRRYNSGEGGSFDSATAVAVGSNGNVFVTGYSTGSGTDRDYATIAYSAAGIPLWTNRYNGPGNLTDGASAVAVDGSGKVFVTGSSTGSGGFFDYATIAYSGGGVPLWTNRYNVAGSENEVFDMAVDRNGNVFVTGSSFSGPVSHYDYATIAYSGSAATLWTNHYNGPVNSSDTGIAVAVDNNGNVFVTGESIGTELIGSGGEYDFDYATIAYSGAGVPLWTNRYNGSGNGHDFPRALALDNSGNVFVTGYSIGSGTDLDYATIAYSGAGVPLWTNRYNGPGNSTDRAEAVAVDARGNVFVTGSSAVPGGSSDYTTIAYSGAGAPLWTNRYNGPANGNDGGSSLAIGPDGAVHVTGGSDSGRVASDYATVKYVWRIQLAIQPLTPGSSNVNLTLSGAPASIWSIERAPMINGPWTNLGSSLVGTNGLGLFRDFSLPTKGAFYRATQP